jgi:hypothetical protein
MSAISCPHCGQVHPEGAQFCPLTGKPLVSPALSCPSCGEMVEAGWAVCAYCGKPLQVQAQPTFNKTVHNLGTDIRKFQLLPSYWKWIAGGLVLLVLVIFLLSRNSSGLAQKPGHYGVYLKEGNRLVEIVQQEGSPGRNTASVPIHTNQDQPVLLVWNPGLNFQNLYLVSDGGEGQEVIYVTTPKDDGMLEIKPRESLQAGIYCLIQADPLGVSYFFPNWCFMVNG